MEDKIGLYLLTLCGQHAQLWVVIAPTRPRVIPDSLGDKAKEDQEEVFVNSLTDVISCQLSLVFGQELVLHLYVSAKTSCSG